MSRLSKSVTLKALPDGSYLVGGAVTVRDGATGARGSFCLRRPISSAGLTHEWLYAKTSKGGPKYERHL